MKQKVKRIIKAGGNFKDHVGRYKYKIGGEQNDKTVELDGI